MSKAKEIEIILRNYRESKEQIRHRINRLESEEAILFKTMLDRLQECEEHHNSYPFNVRSELATALD